MCVRNVDGDKDTRITADMNNLENKQIKYALSLATASVVLNFLTLFVILLWWNTSGSPRDWNSVAVSLSGLQIFLIIVALGGFWIFRGIVREQAEETARSLAKPVAREIAATTALFEARRTAEAFFSQTYTQADEENLQDLANAMDDESGGGDAK
jgi:hypothetical protein